MNANLGYTFYNDIYEISPDKIKSDPERIKSLLNSKILVRPAIIGNKNFQLYSTYPGLITGIGLVHGVKNDNDDFKIGFSFDHTTGLPIIPGSSIKGMLRSAFPVLEKIKALKEVKAKWIQALLDGMTDRDFLEKTYQPLDFITEDQMKTIALLEKEIFDGEVNGKNVSIYKRDIFYDAVITSVNKVFLGTDYITPHYPDVLKNPIPIKFLKILPDIEFTFQFHLNDGILKMEEKKLLFQKILLTIGIGAKTNVGYGQLVVKMPDAYKKEVKRPITSQIKNPLPPHSAPALKLPQSKALEKVKPGDKISGTVEDNTDGKLLFKVDVVGDYKVKPLKYGSSSDYKIGRKAVLEVANKQPERGVCMLTVKNPEFLPE